MNIQLKSQATPDARHLVGKVALVTGSTSGIGLGIARALAAAGANVVLNGFVSADEIARTMASRLSIQRPICRDVLLAPQPNKRFATVEEIGALAVFSASEAATSITGITLPVDGGWTAH